MTRFVVLLCSLVFTVAACGSSSAGVLQAKDSWARFTGDSGGGAAYVTLDNQSTTGYTLTGVSVASDLAASATIHETTTSGDMMGMQMVSKLVIAPKQKLQMRPGTNHIMLTGVKNAPSVGVTFQMTLQFENAQPLTVDVEVRS